MTASLALTLLACGGKDDTPRTDDSGHTDSGDSAHELPPSPCADGGWGAISAWETAIHVSADGRPEGDGSWADPISELDVAMDLLRARDGDRHLALWPGTYAAGIDLSMDQGDDGTLVQGCSAAEVVLEGADSAQPVLEVNAATGVEIEGICTRGGTRGIQVWNGAQVTLVALRVEDASEVGLIVHGNSVQATLDEVEVYGAASGTGTAAYGMAFQEGATVTMTGGGVWSSATVGMLLDDVAETCLTGVVIDGTRADAEGHHGRGLQVQSDSGSIEVRDSTFTENQGAGIFAMEVISLSLSGNTIQATAAGSIPDSPVTTGDGIVFTRGVGNRDPATFQGVFESNTIQDSARAGVLLDGVTCQVSDNTLTGNGYSAILAQGPADTSGTDPVTALTDTEALGLNLEPLTTIDPAAH